MSEMAAMKLELRRPPRGLMLRWVGLKVFVDGHKIGKIEHGSEETFDIPPGHHSINVGGYWGPDIELDFSAGETRNLECGVNSDIQFLAIGLCFGALVFGYFERSYDYTFTCGFTAIWAALCWKRFYYLKEILEDS